MQGTPLLEVPFTHSHIDTSNEFYLYTKNFQVHLLPKFRRRYLGTMEVSFYACE